MLYLIYKPVVYFDVSPFQNIFTCIIIQVHNYITTKLHTCIPLIAHYSAIFFYRKKTIYFARSGIIHVQCSSSWIPNFIDFLYKMVEYWAIEGKHIILWDKVPFYKFGDIHMYMYIIYSIASRYTYMYMYMYVIATWDLKPKIHVGKSQGAVIKEWLENCIFYTLQVHVHVHQRFDPYKAFRWH